MSQMKKCSVCEKEIAKNAKVCPSCGAKQKKPIWKKWWIWLIAVIVVVAAASSGGENDTNKGEIKQEVANENIVYEEYTVNQLVDDLDSNAMSAEQKYSDKYLKISGRLNVIDSDGDYISLYPANDDFALMGVQCYLKNDEQKTKVASMNKGDIVSAKVKIKSIGEIMGYSADVIEFVE